FRMRSKWHHTTSFTHCYDAKFNISEDIPFKAKNFFPSYFETVQFERKSNKLTSNMVGKKAPDWVLKDVKSNEVELSKLKSKVLVIQFTGIGCGPCHHSVPFVKQLVEDYKDKDFEFVSIETWSNNIDGLKRYQERNEFNFKFLKSNDDVNKAYDISSVPAFFIIDENRIIREVIRGYQKNLTDSKIIENINMLL
ncbi:MAG: TlpA disulfide reductase family protein, partial [Bacteroidota bacterium]|nr:TlpA disulfide reductase family protein [Bacteroidota bacterium]